MSNQSIIYNAKILTCWIYCLSICVNTIFLENGFNTNLNSKIPRSQALEENVNKDGQEKLPNFGVVLEETGIATTQVL